MATFAGNVEKHPGEKLFLVFDFGDLPELAAGATITGQSIPAVSGITITGVALVGSYRVGAWYEGGTDLADYDVTCNLTLSDGSTPARTGTLQVRKKG